jgi:hypothetical protein
MERESYKSGIGGERGYGHVGGRLVLRLLHGLALRCSRLESHSGVLPRVRRRLLGGTCIC